MALIIWISVSSQGRTDKTFLNIPYELRNIPLNMEIIDKGIGIVRISIRGPQNLISSLKSDDITIPIALPNDIEQGKVQLTINNNNVQTPFSNQLSILQVSPSNITVHLEELITDTRLINPFIKGSPIEGFKLTGWEIEPETVKIKGPANTLANLDKVMTEPIDITGVKYTFNQRVKLQSSNKFIHIVQPKHATVTIKIEEKIIERSFPEFEVTILAPDPDPGINLNPRVITITLKGPQSNISSLQPKDISVIADCQNLDPGTHEIILKLTGKSEQIHSYLIVPPKIKVIIPKPKP